MKTGVCARFFGRLTPSQSDERGYDQPSYFKTRSSFFDTPRLWHRYLEESVFEPPGAGVHSVIAGRIWLFQRKEKWVPSPRPLGPYFLLFRVFHDTKPAWCLAFLPLPTQTTDDPRRQGARATPKTRSAHHPLPAQPLRTTTPRCAAVLRHAHAPHDRLPL